ncbi:MAG: hypothetical protein FWD74_04065, partial [Actinomycetia bacterium]|nr:hypothetical protein [Actinomycetes bacterium]
MSIVTPRRLLRAAVLAGALSVSLLATLAPAHASAPAYTTTTDQKAAAAGWLATQPAGGNNLPQPGGDHFGNATVYGGVTYPYAVNYGENADVIFGLAAAKSGKPVIDTLLKYLQDNIVAYADPGNATEYGPYSGAVGKAALAAIVAGADPDDFGGQHLMDVLREAVCADAQPTDDWGSTPCWAIGAARNIYSSTSESFVLLAQARAGGDYVPTENAVTYFLSLQCPGGGFTADTLACTDENYPTPDSPDAHADVDSTAYAIMALQALQALVYANDLYSDLAESIMSAAGSAISWLQGQMSADGSWAENTNSTGLAAAALLGGPAVAFAAPVGATPDPSLPRTWLLSQQVPAGQPGAGAVRYDGTFTATTKNTTSPSVLATAQTLPGLVPLGSLAFLTAGEPSDTIALFPPVAKLTSGKAKAGKSVTFTGTGFPAGETVNAALHSTTVPLGTGIVAPDGTVKFSATIPPGFSGPHKIVITGPVSGLSASITL